MMEEVLIEGFQHMGETSRERLFLSREVFRDGAQNCQQDAGFGAPVPPHLVPRCSCPGCLL